jgi:hypothetical protein
MTSKTQLPQYPRPKTIPIKPDTGSRVLVPKAPSSMTPPRPNVPSGQPKPAVGSTTVTSTPSSGN